MSRRGQRHYTVRGRAVTEYVFVLGAILLSSVFVAHELSHYTSSIFGGLGRRLPSVTASAWGGQSSGASKSRPAAGRRLASAGKPPVASGVRTASRPAPAKRPKTPGFRGGGLGTGSSPKRPRPDDDKDEKKPTPPVEARADTFQILLAR